MLNKLKIADVDREIYFPWTEENGTPVLFTHYLGPGLKREEVLRYEVSSDWYEGGMVRTSQDNGKTWTDWKSQPIVTEADHGCVREQLGVAWCYDSNSGQTLRFVTDRFVCGQGPDALRKLWETGEKTLFDHGFWQMSSDEGQTWSAMKQLRYEDGEYHSDDNCPSMESLKSNQMYLGYGAILIRNGTIVYPVAEIPVQIEHNGETEKVDGVLCFIGKWDAASQTYVWNASQHIAVPHHISGRGLLEPAITELNDGRLLLEMRGSTDAIEVEWKGKVESPGRRWISISEDGGHSWSPVTDMRYDDGEQFYSPSTFSMFLRHSRTGKLYWFGNITPTPPNGNLPRYPLYLAEVDETVPALKKDTLTVIDDYDKVNDSPAIQFSNFRILENRETGAIELYMTRYGECKSDRLKANQYKYTIRLHEANS